MKTEIKSRALIRLLSSLIILMFLLIILLVVQMIHNYITYTKKRTNFSPLCKCNNSFLVSDFCIFIVFYIFYNWMKVEFQPTNGKIPKPPSIMSIAYSNDFASQLSQLLNPSQSSKIITALQISFVLNFLK